MSFATVSSYSVSGITATQVTVEAHLSPGLPKFTLVGLPEAVVKESKERVRSALITNQLPFPKQRITINLAPADLPKQGGCFDLPIALGILAAQGVLKQSDLHPFVFCGELSLSGKLRPITGALAMLLVNHKTLILPASQPECQALPQAKSCLIASQLLEVIAHLKQQKYLPKTQAHTCEQTLLDPDFKSVIGQSLGKYALMLSAVGGHALRFIGPPGCGKSLLAHLLVDCLPTLNETDTFTCATLRAAAQLPIDFSTRPPFRAPHHSISQAGLIGGGTPVRPGEISLAHKGVLFLDEVAEIPRKQLDSLREPIEKKHIHIARAGHHVQFPAEFQLICAMNPCPCGYNTHPHISCQCTPQAIQTYQTRISGPLLDRIGLHVHLNPPAHNTSSSTDEILLSIKYIQTLREAQQQRQGCLNHQLNAAHAILKKNTSPEAHTLLSNIYQKQHLSMRALGHLHTTALTIADISDSPHISAQHIEQALVFQKNITHKHATPYAI